MIWDEATRREIERILRHIPPLRAHVVSDLFHPEDRYAAATHPERFSVVTDPDDRKFAALAHAAGATLISSDDHLLRHRDRLEVTVLTPSAFWRDWQRSNQV
jgi:predicted nucleic acid-binding protein